MKVTIILLLEPFQGAATGVGGILRDIMAMGARPIGILDFLRFGFDENSYKLLRGAQMVFLIMVIHLGANLGGDLYRHESYNKNPLVNVAC